MHAVPTLVALMSVLHLRKADEFSNLKENVKYENVKLLSGNISFKIYAFNDIVKSITFGKIMLLFLKTRHQKGKWLNVKVSVMNINLFLTLTEFIQDQLLRTRCISIYILPSKSFPLH